MVMKPPPHSIDKHSTFDVDARPDNLLASRDTIPFMILAQQIVQHGMRVTFVSSDKHIASLEQAK